MTTTVILDEWTDWNTWLRPLRDKAIIAGIWETCCDPEIKKEDIKELKKPEMPQKESLLHCWDAWEIEYSIYTAKKTAHDEILIQIVETVARRHLYLINETNTVYETLKALAERLSPMTQEREFELLKRYEAEQRKELDLWKQFLAQQRRKFNLKKRYQALQKIPEENKMAKWLDDWVRVTAQMKREDLPDVANNRAQYDFIRAVNQISPAWAVPTFMVFDEANKADKTTVESMIADFRSYRSKVELLFTILAPQQPREVAKDGKDSQRKRRETLQGPSPNSRQRRNCFCGQNHRWTDCWYMNTTHPGRPKAWKANPKAQAKVEVALQDPDTLARAQKAFARRGLMLIRTDSRISTTSQTS